MRERRDYDMIKKLAHGQKGEDRRERRSEEREWERQRSVGKWTSPSAHSSESAAYVEHCKRRWRQICVDTDQHNNNKAKHREPALRPCTLVAVYFFFFTQVTKIEEKKVLSTVFYVVRTK